jgi:hypothetical protein
MKLKVPLAITIILVLLQVADYYFKVPVINTVAANFTVAILVMSAIAVGIGIISLTRIHVRRIVKKRPHSLESAIMLITLAIFILVGAVLGSGDPSYIYMFQNIIVPLDSAMFSLAGFFMASAAYRAFRARSKEALILLVAAVIVMLGQAPIGEAFWSGFPILSQWILDVPNTGGVRALIMGIAIGMLSLTVRMLMGHEKGYLGTGA